MPRRGLSLDHLAGAVRSSANTPTVGAAFCLGIEAAATDIVSAEDANDGRDVVGRDVSFLTDADQDRVRAFYGAAKYERLARIKARYDPDNLFHPNANIRPFTRRTP